MQSVPITTEVVSSNIAHGKVYLIQHYVIKFVIDLWQVGGFLPVVPIFSTNKTDCHNIAENIVESGIKHHNPTPSYILTTKVIGEEA